jgi:hypothetical protein
MTAASGSEVLQQCGMHEANMDADGMPELLEDEVFSKTFDEVSLVIGGEHDLGQGKLHLTSMCALEPAQRASFHVDLHRLACCMRTCIAACLLR